MLHAIAELLFPARCFACGRRGRLLCAGRRKALPYTSPQACARCGAIRRRWGPCRACLLLPAYLAGVRAVCIYEGAARRAVHQLKFRGGRCLAPLIAELMLDRARRLPRPLDLVVPAPLGPIRLRERGYNQAAALAEPIAFGLGVPFAEPLAREDRPPQQTLDARARARNLRGALWCAEPGWVERRSVLLVDDVATTGATLGGCARALVDGGARRVWALVFARDP